MMWVSVIAAIICFAVGTMLFMPMLRDFEFYRPLSIYFIFEGCWMIINWAVLEIFDNAIFMFWVQYIGSIFFVGYLAHSLYKISAIKKADINNNEKANHKIVYKVDEK